jgi:hypothetical protein
MRKLMGNDLGEIMNGESPSLIDLNSPGVETSINKSDVQFDFMDPDTDATEESKKNG